MAQKTPEGNVMDGEENINFRELENTFDVSEPEIAPANRRRSKKRGAATGGGSMILDVSSQSQPPFPPSQKKLKAKKKRATASAEVIEQMFDFHSSNKEHDDAATPRRRGRPPKHLSTPAAAAVAFVATPACYLSKKERAEIERKFSKPKNESQKKYSLLLNDPSKKVVIATGPAGTGKTLLAAEYAVRNFILGEYEKIIFTRPSVSVDEDLGYLPGTLEEKMAPWMRPLYDILYEHFTARETAAMVEEKVIEICPLGFMRGRTFKGCCIICDEMQNSTPAQMKMLLTRIGAGSRLIITGDLDQCDMSATQQRSQKYPIENRSDPYCNGLEDFLRRLGGKKSESIVNVEFKREDIEREEVVKEILDIYGME